MEIVSCGKGHFYDKSKGECPQCAAERAAKGGNKGIMGGFMDYGKTVPSDTVGVTVPDSSGFNGGYANEKSGRRKDNYPTSDMDWGLDKTVSEKHSGNKTNDFQQSRRNSSHSNQIEDYEETRFVGFDQEDNFNPVVGWLACVDGPDKGKDYRIHAGKNHVGRKPNNDIFIQGDKTISQENSCLIAYDELSGIFYFADGTGRNMVYVNNKAVFSQVELHAYDVIRVGRTSLIFVPLCGEKFSWNK